MVRTRVQNNLLLLLGLVLPGVIVMDSDFSLTVVVGIIRTDWSKALHNMNHFFRDK